MGPSSQEDGDAAGWGLAHPVGIALGLCLIGLAGSWVIWRLGLVTEDSALMSAFVCVVVCLGFLSFWFRDLIWGVKLVSALVVWIWNLFNR
ncbi:hypothetical protein LOK46_04775 [Methylobacterium sp. NMS14P]|uniref:hypothetical protein n=1 Tax=Methylobacterium sp. NMS14P TaxID=2894310 RepID=UPI0023589747|nr:hypothetical protein [Methylobacterium sp. NMS14P]WCS26153.1 hypothetical protein LOK46_04775 [Methylobacterium sp. NMS14P]